MDWLDQILGKWGAALAKAAMSAAIVLILIFLLTCCIVPILRRQFLRTVNRQTDVKMGLQGARMVNVLVNGQTTHMCPAVQGLLGDADLFPVPDYMDDEDDPEDDSEVEEKF